MPHYGNILSVFVASNLHCPKHHLLSFPHLLFPPQRTNWNIQYNTWVLSFKQTIQQGLQVYILSCCDSSRLQEPHPWAALINLCQEEQGQAAAWQREMSDTSSDNIQN